MRKRADDRVLTRADEARGHRDWPAAAELYQSHLSSKPRDFAIWVQLGHALKEAGRLVDALVAYSEALALNDRDSDLLLNLGHLHKLMGSCHAAADCYRRSVTLDGNADALAELDQLGTTLGETTGGLAVRAQASTISDQFTLLPASLRTWVLRLRKLRGRQAQRLGDEARDRLDWVAAAEHYRRHIKVWPDHFPILVQLGHALKELRQFNDALNSYKMAVQIDPNNSDLLLNLGHLFKLMGDDTAAIAHYQLSVRQNGNTDAAGELVRLRNPAAPENWTHWRSKSHSEIMLHAGSIAGQNAIDKPLEQLAAPRLPKDNRCQITDTEHDRRFSPDTLPVSSNSIISSGLFDKEWYQRNYPDVSISGFDPLEHYLAYGWREGRNPGPYFDTEWYRDNYPDVAAADINPFEHYCTRGIHEARAPNPKAPAVPFDAQWYTDRYEDIRQAGINPLTHYLAAGTHEGRFPNQEAERDHQLSSRPITSFEIHCLKYTTPTREVAIFVTHSPDGKIKTHVIQYIKSLQENNIDVILLIAADHPVSGVPDDVMALVSSIYVRENLGYDFAAWSHILQIRPELFSSQILYLLNDSLFGPLNAEKFLTILRSIRNSAADIVGLTDSYEHDWHVQSFFLAFKNKALSSVALHRFFNEVVCLTNKDDVIRRYEVTFAERMRERGLLIEVLFPSKQIPRPETLSNTTLFCWKELIALGFPFVKVMVLRDSVNGIDRCDWENVLKTEGYDVKLVEQILNVQGTLPSVMAADDESEHSKPPLATPVYPKPKQQRKVAFIGPWNYDNGLGFASRGYVSALWNTKFSVNLAPIRAPFHIHKRSAPMVSTNSFAGEADLAIVHLNPDAWPGLLSDEHMSIMSQAHKVVGLWVWETTDIPNNWYPMFDSVDGIWTPSNYCASVFQSRAKVPIEVVPHVVTSPVIVNSTKDEAYAIRHELGISPTSRIILYCFDGASYLVRKNPFALVSAFAASGLASAGWILVLKTKNLFDSEAQGLRLSAMVKAEGGVVLLDRSLERGMMNALMRVADIYASPHCSEGFGLTIAEAMSWGKLVIATDYSGSRDFLDAVNGVPVAYKLKALLDDHGHYTQGNFWAEIGETELVHALKQCAERVDAGDHSMGMIARDRIKHQLSSRAVGDAIESATAKLFGN